MNLPRCFICSSLVVELAGQFEKLDSYLLAPGDAVLEAGAFGWCHGACLSDSEWGLFWATRRLRHFVDTLGWHYLGRSDDFAAVRDPRDGETLVLRADGVSFRVPRDLTDAEGTKDGLLIPVGEEFNLELDVAEVAHKVRTALRADGSYSLVQLLESLGVIDRLLYPDAIRAGRLEYDEDLAADWFGNWISVEAHYARFLPEDVVAFAAAH